MTPLPFDLSFQHGVWRSFWKDERLRIAVAGSPTHPEPAHRSTLVDLVGRWTAVKLEIVAFARALDGHVSLEPSTRGGFDASICGFDEDIYGFSALLVEDPEDPSLAFVLFDTGLPDGYVMFRATVRAGALAAITAFAS